MGYEALMRQAYDHLNAGDLEGFGAMLADDMVEHEEAAGLPQNKDGVIQFFRCSARRSRTCRWNVEDLAMAGDRIWTRVRITGTNDGDFMGMPATGKSVDFQGIDIVRISDAGKAVEHWGVTDTMAMMQQLGAVPTPA